MDFGYKRRCGVCAIAHSQRGAEFADLDTVQLEISRIHPIEWNKRAFDRLVLDKKTKELITALVQVRIAPGRAEDIIEGKGNGLMILLHGGPGTGKTLTAGMS